MAQSLAAFDTLEVLLHKLMAWFTANPTVSFETAWMLTGTTLNHKKGKWAA